MPTIVDDHTRESLAIDVERPGAIRVDIKPQ
jgi:hypothetical protein